MTIPAIVAGISPYLIRLSTCRCCQWWQINPTGLAKRYYQWSLSPKEGYQLPHFLDIPTHHAPRNTMHSITTMLHTFSVVCTEVVMSDPNRHVGNEVVPLGSFCIRTRRVELCSRAWHVCLEIAVISALPLFSRHQKILVQVVWEILVCSLAGSIYPLFLITCKAGEQAFKDCKQMKTWSVARTGQMSDTVIMSLHLPFLVDHHQPEGGADVTYLHWQASEGSLLLFVPVSCHLNQPQAVVCPQAQTLEMLYVSRKPPCLDGLLVCLCWCLQRTTCNVSYSGRNRERVMCSACVCVCVCVCVRQPVSVNLIQ